MSGGGEEEEERGWKFEEGVEEEGDVHLYYRKLLRSGDLEILKMSTVNILSVVVVVGIFCVVSCRMMQETRCTRLLNPFSDIG